MRKLLLGLSALGLLAFALPTPPANAEEGKVVIKTGEGNHEGWRHRHHHKKIVMIKHRRHRDRDHDRM